jgi:serine/threonine protein kinase
MTPERWRFINSLLDETLDRSPEERAAFLDDACGADDVSRKEVESLVSFQGTLETFLEVPALDAAADLFVNDPSGRAGTALGAYRIGSHIGAGGMGDVYLAEDSRLDRKVAIKVLPPDLQSDDLARKRQIREARAAAKLDHPNICAIYEVAEADGENFIVMQYVEGETLAARIKRGRMDVVESLDIALQIADALCLAHSRGVIHRDIKPQNVMITPRGHVKMLDFGLAKEIRLEGTEPGAFRSDTGLSVSGMIMGTVPYMSPEQAKGAPADPRSDLFSLGAVLYECVTGRHAFSGNTPVEVCGQVLHVDPPAPSQVAPGTLAQVESIILKLLAKEPDARYQSAEDLLEELRQASGTLGNERDLAPRPATPIPWRQALLKTAGWRGVVALALVIAMALLVVYRLWPLRPGHKPPSEAVYFYDQGVAALNEGLYYKASKALKQAVNADDAFALAHARLAEALAEMDYTDEARAEMIQAQLHAPDRSMLPPVDALLFEGIARKVANLPATAIQSYQERVRQTTDARKPQAYYELGIAYEENDQLDNARGSYELSTGYNAPEVAGSYLRLGTLCAEQQDTGCADAAFAKAKTLYQDLNNTEGVTEVLYQSGLSYANLNRLPEARSQLEKAVDMARTLGYIHQQIRALLELSRVSYSQGETMLAEQQANDAMDLAQHNDMENLLTRGLIEMGNAFRVRGDYDDAEKYLEKALGFAQRNKGRRNEAKARVALGALRITVHDADRGLDYVNQALEFYEKGGYRRETAMALYQSGRAYELKGEIEKSRTAYDRQFQLAQEIGDQSLLALAHRGLAVTLVYQDQFPQALDHFETSCSIYRGLDNQLYLGNRLIDCGDMLWRLGRYQQAREKFDEAVSIAERPSIRNKQMWDSLSLVEAYMELSQRHFPAAISRGEQALSLNARNEHGVEAKSLIGLARSLSGSKREGLKTCEEAVQAARRAVYPPILSEALLCLAEAMLEAGDIQGSLKNALEASSRFQSAGQQEANWRALLTAARASVLTGDEIRRDYATQAESLLARLRESWGVDAYGDYLARPDIQRYRWLLTQLAPEK